MEEQKRYTDRFLRTEKIEKHKKKSKLLDLPRPAKRISGFQVLCDTLCGLHLGDQGFHALVGLFIQVGKVCPELAGKDR